MNGAGNDFVVLNNLEEHLPVELLPQIAKTLCERHLSIGADGLMVVDAPTQGGDYKMRFYNSDGSVGEMCGNGARCICRYGYETGLAGDTQTVETTNNRDLLFFTDKGTVYKAKAADFSDTKASVLGDYVAAKLGFDEGESARYMAVTGDYSGYMFFFFENGKVAKVELSSYATKTNRRKLVGAYSDKSPVVAIVQAPEDGEFMLTATSGRMLLVHTGAIAAKATRNTIGVQVMTLKGRHLLQKVEPFTEGMVTKSNRYRTKTIPAAGALPLAEDIGEQLTLD